MKSMLKIVCSVAVLTTIMIGTATAEVLTLDDCIELALKNRATIISAIGREQAASADKRSALGAFLPRISASYTYQKSKETDVTYDKQNFDITPGDTYLVNATDTFLNPVILTIEGQPTMVPTGIEEASSPDQDRTSKSLTGQARMDFSISQIYNYSATSAGHAAAKLSVLASEQDLIYSVKISYFAYLATVENLATQEDAVKRADEQLKLIQSRYDLGSASKSDLLKQKVQFGNDRLALLKAKNSVTTAKARIAYTVGVDPRKDWEISRDYERRQWDGSVDEAIDFGLSHKPSLLASEKGLAASKYGYRATKWSYLPSLSAWASITRSEGTRGDTVTFEQSSQSRSLGLQVNWNIFDGFGRQNSIAKAKIRYNDNMAGLSDAKNLAVSNIKTAYHDIEQLEEQKTVSGENVDAATEDLRITQEKYNLGAATILDLLDAQVSLKKAEVSLIQAEFDLNLAVAKLENAMGKM